MKTNIHHNIPVSLGWEDIQENKIRLDTRIHDKIHKEQNLSQNKVREYRMRVNGLLLPDDTFFELRADTWKQYFANAKTEVPKQKWSLARQANRYYRMLSSEYRQDKIGSFDDMIDELISVQKWYVKQRIIWLL